MISIHIARLDESVSSLVLQMQLPSSELTDPQLWEKENARLKHALGWKIMLVPRRVLEIYENPSVGLAGLQSIHGKIPRFNVVRCSWGKISTSLIIHITNPGKMVGDESAVIPKSLNKNYVVRVWSKTWVSDVSGTFQDAGYKQYIFLWVERLLKKKQFVPCDLHNIHSLLFCLHYDNHAIIYISIFRRWRLSLPSWPKTTRSGWPKPLGFLHKGDDTPSAAI